MEVTDNDFKFGVAFILGTAVVLANVLPFIFRIINKTKEAKEQDNFNLFIVIINTYFYQLIVCTAIATLVYILDLMDEVDYLNLLGSGGAMDLFWSTGVDSSSPITKTFSYLIKWVRSLFEWLCLVSAIVLMFFGMIGGYQYQKRMSAKNGSNDDWLPYVASAGGLFLSTVLLYLFSYITKDSLFIGSSHKAIHQVIQEIIVTSVGL